MRYVESDSYATCFSKVTIAMTLALEPLPYNANALEPYISEETVRLHHGTHQAGYVKRVNAITESLKLGSRTLAEIIAKAHTLHDPVLFNMTAQVWNHEFYWKSLRPGGGDAPGGAIRELIERDFGSYQNFEQQLHTTATGLFGSGWVWVVLDHDRIAITATTNAELPRSRQTPLLTIDVWEHAYYVDYRAGRAKYVSGVIEHLLNWEFANSNLQASDVTGHSRSVAPTQANA